MPVMSAFVEFTSPFERTAPVSDPEPLDGCGRVYQRLAEQIAALMARGEFAVGDRLPSERALAERFKVSRTVIREAIIALEVQDFVEVRMGSGIYVRGKPRSGATTYVAAGPGPFELLQARRLLEAEIAAQAALVRQDKDVDRINAALLDMRAHFHDKRANEAYDQAFHLRIAQATGNAVLVQMVGALWSQLRGPIWVRLEGHFHTSAMRQASLLDHQAIVSAIASRDGNQARLAMHQHLDRVINEFIRGWS
jgi:DNA-binding FadR family transcriptional regulator